MELPVDKFKHNWVELKTESSYLNWLAINKWKCPRSKINRQELSEADWETIHNYFINAGPNVETCKEADLCATFYNNKGTSFLIWLAFKGTDGKEYKLDVYIDEKQASGKINCVKKIDPRSPKCVDIYNSIVNQGSINPNIAKLLHSVGAKTWTDPMKTRVQKKLNSEVQSSIFEEACKECEIKYIRLDPFDDFLYYGDPGQLADYDLIIDNQKIRIDLKLLENLTTEKFCQQKGHDAQFLIGSNWHNGESTYYKVDQSSPAIENMLNFNKLLQTFSRILVEVGPVFLHINNIDTNTGKVDFIKFGNSHAY